MHVNFSRKIYYFGKSALTHERERKSNTLGRERHVNGPVINVNISNEPIVLTGAESGILQLDGLRRNVTIISEVVREDVRYCDTDAQRSPWVAYSPFAIMYRDTPLSIRTSL